MIHSEKDFVFISASQNGWIEMMKFLIEQTPNQKRKEKMIHTKNDYPFQIASNNGRFEVLKYLIEITPNQEHRDKMIHSSDDYAFRRAASYENTLIMKYLLDLTPNHKRKEEMIRSAFLFICISREHIKNGYPTEVMKFLLDNFSNEKRKDEMIHFGGDLVFLNAYVYDNIKLLELLLEHTLNNEKRQLMVRQVYMLIRRNFDNDSLGRLLLTHLDDKTLELDRYYLETNKKKLFLEVIQEREKKRVIDLCITLEMDSEFINHLSKDFLRNLLLEFKHWRLLKNLYYVVKDGLFGFQVALHPSLPDEIFSTIIFYFSDNLVERLPEHLKNASRIQYLLKYYFRAFLNHHDKSHS
jgi:ankyrin repeat protein